MQKMLYWLFSAVIALNTLLLSGCANAETLQTPSSPAATNQSSPTASPSASLPSSAAGLPRLEGKATVEMAVKGGTVVMEIDGTNAPITAGNFIDLVQKGVYNGTMFHRVVREPEPFVAQGGDPQSKDPKVPVEQLGTGSYEDPTTKQPRYVPLEIKPKGGNAPVYSKEFRRAGIDKPPVLNHRRGAVAMARSQFPDSASAQFYIALANLDFLDGNYAVFGYVTSGMELVDSIQQGDRITSMKVTKGADALKPAGKA